ncbi:MAG TPA: LamG domain-containing protein, partial [Candidatus Baltobacteraceae bacterium]|nr:LamG domain-containing protein [Candidatus Baltobacteraceae bacterium]
MSPLVHPISVSHQGMSVLFVSQFDEAKQQTTISYNVLDPSRGNPDNNLDWLGYRTLTFPTQVATAAMSVARQTRSVNSRGLLQAVSDQQFIYLFRSEQNSIYVNRYGLVQVPPSNPQGDPNWELRPTWEVRYRRSGKADVPANQTDTPSAFDMNGAPFVDPVYELPLGTNGINLEQASFWASLQPTQEEGTFRWQLFVPNLESGRIAAYSFERTPDGWFAIASEQIDEETSVVLPDAEIELRHNGELLKAGGPLTATNYSRQEPVFTDSSGVISMKRATRVLLAVQVIDTTQATRLVTIDFGVSLEGTLAGLEPPADDRIVPWEAGKVQPAGSMLEFDGASAVQIIDSPTSGPLYLPQTFTMEAWVNPSSTTLDSQFVIGGRIADPAAQQAPSMFIVDKLRVGVSFGDGTNLISNVTKGNVLSLNAWNHIAVENDAAGARIFVNGVQMELESPLVPGLTPCNTPVASIGARAQWQTSQVRGEQVTAAADTEHEYTGLLDEVRIWNKALTAEEIAKYLYREIPADEAAKMPELLGYWRLDDGGGKIAYDLSQYKREGHLSGPRWESTTSPVLPEQGAAIYFDEHGLTSVVGILLPEPDHPNFVNLAAGSRVALLESADGLVHLYFQGNGTNRFFGAQFDTTIDRAYYSFPWVAGASEPKDKQTGVFVPVARQSGSVLNHATFTVTPSANAYLCDLALDDGRGTTEQWKGLPRRVATMISALNGDSISQPMDHRLNDLTKAFYDYSGTVPIAILQAGNPDTADLLWFLSARSGPFKLKRIALTAPSAGKGDLTIDIASDAAHPEETLTRTLRGVPADPAAFSLTLRGGNPNFDYSSSANPDGTIAYAIPALPTPLSAFIAGTAITSARFTITSASSGDTTLCDFIAELNPEADAGPQATWRNVPRDGTKFVAAVYAGTDPDQKKVLELIRIMNPGHTTLVNGTAAAPANVISFLSTFNAVNDGITEELPAFDCQTAVLQGASTNVTTVELANGSQIVAATNPIEPSNGYPALIDLGTAGSVTATMLKPGKDGGWLNEPPRSAVRIHTDGLLKGDATTQDAKALAPANDLTVEAWAMILESPPGLEPYYPRILQNVVSKADSVDRYMLGLAMTSTLQFLRNTIVSANDDAVPDTSAQLRLFPEEDFTVQFYIRPDLSTPTSQNKLFEKLSATPSASVKLSAERDGTLSLVIIGTNGSTATSTPVAGDPVKLRDKVWQCVTVSRGSTRATVYVDGVASQYIDNPPSTKTAHSGLVVGANDVPQPLQMR